MRMPAIQKHRDLVREMHGTEAGPPLLADFCVCTSSMDGAETTARQYMGKFVESNFYHYELLGPHFTTVKGYDAYAQKIALAREIGMDGIVSAFMEAAVWGPPDRILRKLEERRALVGDFELATSFRFGGTPYDLAESGLRLYAKEAMRSAGMVGQAGDLVTLRRSNSRSAPALTRTVNREIRPARLVDDVEPGRSAARGPSRWGA